MLVFQRGCEIKKNVKQQMSKVDILLLCKINSKMRNTSVWKVIAIWFSSFKILPNYVSYHMKF